MSHPVPAKQPTLAYGLVFALATLAPPLFFGEASAKEAATPVQLPPRAWDKFPAIVEVKASGDIYAIGDGHGDYERFAGLLAKAGLIKEVPSDPLAVKWTGGSAVLVCTGDLIDKAPKQQPGGSLKLVRLMRRLMAVAPKGQVVLTLGNHEATFLAYPGEKKVSDFVADLATAGILVDSVTRGDKCTASDASEGCQLGAFLRGLPLAAKVDSWFFSHAGNTGGRTVAELEQHLRTTIDGARGFAPVIDDPDSILEARLCSASKPAPDEDGDGEQGPAAPCPWWGADPKATLERNAAALKVAHIVQGHQAGEVAFPANRQRSKGALFQKYGLIFLIDGGMSRHPKVSRSGGGVLRIATEKKTTRASVICADKQQRKPIWSANLKESVEDEVVCP